jgi:phospholipid/cholesterol/gamma-HCH transport system substrate-binding protein
LVPERGESEGAGTERERSPLVRLALIAGPIAAAVLVALLLFAGSDAYTVKARFLNAGQLVKGNPVQTGGTPIGSVKGIKITAQGLAEIKLQIDDDHAPLRQGTRAAIRQFSQSGIANRYVDLTFPPAGGSELPDGGLISTDKTKTQVDLDELFNTLDPKTRKSLQRFFKGSAEMFAGRGWQAREGFHYLNPALSTGSRLFQELTRDDRLLRRFLIDSSELVTALGERRDDLQGVVSNLNTTFGALGRQKAALAESIGRLPPFMRRANTTFVNLRAALDDVDPLVDAAKPAVRRLGPFLDQARMFTADAEPTIRDLSRTIRRSGGTNDLIELIDSFPPLERVAMETRRINGADRRGAFPESEEAFRRATPTIAVGRPYTPEFVAWMDDFSTTGAYDALGGFSRAWINLSEILYGPGPKTK